MEIRPIRVVQYGLGATGKRIAALVDRTPGLLLVGGIDHKPEQIGEDLGIVMGLDHPLGIRIEPDPTATLAATHPDVVVLATTSRLEKAYHQIDACLRARANVISTCEELIYPHVQYPELASKLDRLARRSGVSLVGAGINPGFVQDMLPLILTGPCTSVERIVSTRVFNANLNRAHLRLRIGAGLSREDFCRTIEQDGRIPHVGLRESVQLIAHCIGWHLDRIEERFDPILASDWVHEQHMTVAPGHVLGIQQSASGIMHGNEVIALTWRVAVGEARSYDEISIEGTPPIHIRIDGGIHGDQSAPALVVHAIVPTVMALPGLLTVADLPPTYYRLPLRTSPEYWSQQERTVGDGLVPGAGVY